MHSKGVFCARALPPVLRLILCWYLWVLIRTLTPGPLSSGLGTQPGRRGQSWRFQTPRSSYCAAHRGSTKRHHKEREHRLQSFLRILVVVVGIKWQIKMACVCVDRRHALLVNQSRNTCTLDFFTPNGICEGKIKCSECVSKEGPERAQEPRQRPQGPQGPSTSWMGALGGEPPVSTSSLSGWNTE